MTCLYASDYGPPDPGFDPLAGGGVRVAGFEAHRGELAHARNLAQLEAMERVLHRGETVTWCTPGYGWVESDAVQAFFIAVLALVVLPYLFWRAGLAARLPLAPAIVRRVPAILRK